MPIEIKELQISINVYDDSMKNTVLKGQKINDIIEQCIEQVAIVEKEKNER